MPRPRKQPSTAATVRVPFVGVALPLKYVALFLCVLQTTTLVLLMRSSRTQRGAAMYLSSTAVVLAEFGKVITCVAILTVQHGGDFAAVRALLYSELVTKSGETLKLAVPAALYTLQNNLLFVALSNLDAAVYQVTYQLKILTTAVFSVVMLGRALSRLQTLSLFFLMAGVALVQISNHKGPAHERDEHFASTSTRDEAAQSLPAAQNATLGLVCVLCSCVSSGFAGVYFERILKGSRTSVWVRNVQLGLFSVVLGLGGCVWKDGAAIGEGGFLQGYTGVVWGVVFLQAAGGLVIAVVIKYADNILKGFATSISIVLSTVISVFFFSFSLTVGFMLGAGLVIGAVFMYGHKRKTLDKHAAISAMKKRKLQQKLASPV